MTEFLCGENLLVDDKKTAVLWGFFIMSGDLISLGI
jgi:hypothetical protein